MTASLRYKGKFTSELHVINLRGTEHIHEPGILQLPSHLILKNSES